MCYHTSTPSKKELEQSFPSLHVSYTGDENYHVSGFTRPFLPVTLNAQTADIVAARWKLIPYWIKTEAEAAKYANTLNAEGERIFEKVSYRNAISKTRGLLYVKGFFEPHKVEGKKETENYYIYKPGQEIFTLGVVYSVFADQETGETYPTFSIITTAANALLSEIHNQKKRMPLIIAADNREAWLNATGKQEIETLI
ncbi:SOS response-associated peptidase [Sphingobacterium sp. Mn56C]|uniref:SOS response-associated peptidase n=1 Tax=Sphingobacterium sp. Mn56C TaxID=3395261 RepID=UPI003BD3EE60